MEEKEKMVRDNILKYLKEQNISMKQLLKDTGIDLEETKILSSEEFLELCSYLRKRPEEFAGTYEERTVGVDGIKKAVRRYEGLLKLVNAKVAFTLEDEAYFFRYNKELESYETFVRLETEEELDMLVAGMVSQELVLDMRDELGDDGELEERLETVTKKYGLDEMEYRDVSMAGDGRGYKKYMKILIERLDKVIQIYDNRTQELEDLLNMLKKIYK